MSSPTPAADPAPKPALRFTAADGLKGIVLWIMWGHYNEIHDPHGALESVYHLSVQMTALTLDVFLAVSGFLVTGVLLRSKGGPHYYRNFFGRRCVRIFPLYYAFLFAWFVLRPMLRPVDFTPGSTQVWYWTYTTNVWMALYGDGHVPVNTIHLWYLSTAVQLYLVWPLVVARSSTASFKRICVTCIAVAPLARIAFALQGNGAAAYMSAFTRVDSFALGALVALWVREPGGLTRWVRPARIALAAGLAVALPVFITAEGITPMNPWEVTVGLMGGTLIAGGLLVLSLNGSLGRWGNAFVNCRVLTQVGFLSYGIYVLHDPLALLLEKRGWTRTAFESVIGHRLGAQLAYTFATALITIAVSWVSWHPFEKHCNKLKRLFPYERS